MFRKHIPQKLVPLQDNPWTKLRDARAAVFFSSLMLVTLVVLVGTTFVPGGAVQVWMVTAPAGISAFVFELINDWVHNRGRNPRVSGSKNDHETELKSIARPNGELSKGNTADGLETANKSDSEAYHHKQEHESDKEQLDAEPDRTNAPVPQDPPSQQPRTKSQTDPSSPPSTPTTTQPTTLTTYLHLFSRTFPRTTRTLALLPLPLLPFAASFFILVRALSQRHWITTIATHIFVPVCTSPATTTFFTIYICACLLCPLAGTNIGATIILVEVIRDPAFLNSAVVRNDPKVLQAAIYAIAMGSNLGAFSYTFAGSLAGLLWRGLLADKGIHISQWKFAVVNAIPLVMQTTLAGAIILGELYWFS